MFRARQLAAASVADGDVTGWFERLYAEGEAGTSVVPWVLGEPNESLVEWAAGLDGTGLRALVVGCGTGEDAEYLAGLGFAVTGFDIAPNQAMHSLHKVLSNFKMPGYTIPDFRRKAVVIASGGVYDPRIHLDDVVMPVLKKWRIFEREDFTGEAARQRDELAALVKELEDACEKFEIAKRRRLERVAKMAEKRAAKDLVSTSAS